MNLRTLVARSLRFHWRSHLGVVLGAAVATTVLVGALVVGDSVRWSLRRMALGRLGKTEMAVVAPGRFFRAGLAEQLRLATSVRAVAVLQVRGMVARVDGAARVGDVQILGVDDGFWAMGGVESPFAVRGGSADGLTAAAVNERTARALGVKAADRVFVRFEKPAAFSLDAPLSGESEGLLGYQLPVTGVALDSGLGRFSLAANQVPPYNVFVPLAWLQEQLDLPGKANLLLVGEAAPGKGTPSAPEALASAFRLADAEHEVRFVPGQDTAEIRTSRVFLDPPVARAAAQAEPDAVGVLTYLVNELRVGVKTTPYSMVTAIGPLGPDGSAVVDRYVARILPADMADDEIVIKKWLVDHGIRAKIGDELTLVYFVPGPMRRLIEKSSTFRIRAVVPMEVEGKVQGADAHSTLMPDFPGLADLHNCRDWKPGFAIDLKKIHTEDEQYWDDYRGTPKAFVTLAAGQRMWRNRFGDLTAIRVPGAGRADVESAVLARLDPAELGLYFRPVRALALAASGQALDFGQLFLGLSFFLIVAALVLTGLLFALGAEQRAEETGMLLAVGFPPRRVRRLMLAEGAALVLVGAAAGTVGGVVYTRLVLWGLATVWQSAVGASDIVFHARPLTLPAGAAAGVVVALVAVWLTLRRQARAPARLLLSAGADAERQVAVSRGGRPWVGFGLAVGCAVGATALLVTKASAKGQAQAGVFFGAGALLLVAGLALCHAAFGRMAASSARRRLSAGGLGLRNATRRPGRSLATVSLVAFGAFLVVAVGVFHRPPPQDAGVRASGTGGFRLLGRTTLPIHYDLLSDDGRSAYALPDDLPQKVRSIVSMRVHEGDDASCLNLNRVQRPQLVGVRPETLARRGSFTFAETLGPVAGDESPWMLLAKRDEPDVVPAIGDAATIQWSVGKTVGDEIAYPDGRGREFRLRIVGALAGSMLQGSLFIAEDAFVERFPTESGYRMLLIDTPAETADEVSAVLSRQLADVGLALVPTADRLAELNAMQNTYLAIFQTLGGLGLLLGSVGLGVVVLRNVLERRGELALARAVGFRKRSLEWLVLVEHWGLLAMGLVCGVVAALLAVAPAVWSARAAVPYVSLAATLAAVAASGMLWTWLATRLALRGPLLAALRNE